jgi:hypothetical protein
MKAQHEQVEVDRSQTLTEFIKENAVQLKRGVKYELSDMAVTSDNKLLLCYYFLCIVSSVDKLYGSLL